jgi:DNA-binding transcriptional MerR regulator
MPPESQTSKRRLAHRQKAEQLGVSTRTLDRWIETGVITAPAVVNRRKYHDEDSQPRRDSERAA